MTCKVENEGEAITLGAMHFLDGALAGKLSITVTRVSCRTYTCSMPPPFPLLHPPELN